MIFWKKNLLLDDWPFQNPQPPAASTNGQIRRNMDYHPPTISYKVKVQDALQLYALSHLALFTLPISNIDFNGQSLLQKVKTTADNVTRSSKGRLAICRNVTQYLFLKTCPQAPLKNQGQCLLHKNIDE